ncbi:MAG TPA: hypothetical protein VGX21_16830 [Methylomirabilota bacterium]|jgi:hypothetical protein|nr:hypothetical protein [Methylomirabilota bacterium]
MLRLDLTADEARMLRDALTAYLVDFQRQVAATEKPDLQETLARREAFLTELLGRLAGARTVA